MGLFDWLRRGGDNTSRDAESRGAVPLVNATGHIPFTVGAAITFIGSPSRPFVSIDEALSVPAVWAAVNFLSRTIGALPFHVYRRAGGKLERLPDEEPVQQLVHTAPNDYQTAFDLWHWTANQLFTEGRAYIYVERDADGTPLAMWPMLSANTSVQRSKRGKIVYRYEGKRTRVYAAKDVIDLAFMRSADGLGHYSPVRQCAGAIRQAINAQRYGLTAFGDNGLPPFVIEGPFETEEGAARAADDVARAAARAMAEGKPALALPSRHKISRILDTPDDMQLVEAQRFAVEEVARIFGLPPVFLQDLSRATFSNAEQQDLHFVKHTLLHWTVAIESEVTLKLFGRGADMRAKFNVDGLLRGDFATRIQGIATGIQNGILTPNEGRALEDRPPLDGGDELFIQGATVPLRSQTGGNGDG